MKLGAGEMEVSVGRTPIQPFVFMPVEWIAAANRCPAHCASKVAVLVWFLHSVTRQKTFEVNNADAEKFSLDRKQKAAGLRALEHAGLISLAAQTGKGPLVTLKWQPARQRATRVGGDVSAVQ